MSGFKMRFERLTSEKHEMYKNHRNYTVISFSPHDQWEVASQAKILKDAEYHFA
jgi:hypothetical protein